MRICAIVVLPKWLYHFPQKDFPDHWKGVSFCIQTLK